jgi:REP element-mobilizing transposase RayT
MKKRHRRSIRLRGYDYTRAGAYFLTMCVHDRAHLFGDVDAGAMGLNDAGAMVERWWSKLNEKFPSIETDAFVIMPNHVHGIIVLSDDHDVTVGADPRVRPMHNDDHDVTTAERVVSGRGGHKGPPLRAPGHVAERASGRVAVGTVVQWFKTMTTNEYIRGVKTSKWPPFDGRVWQRDYWERIVRDADELRRIRRYIANNPRRWWRDRNNPNGRIIAPFAGQRIVED